MSRRREPLLRPAQARYLRHLLSPRDPLLAAVERRPPGVGPEPAEPAVIRLLEVLAAATRPQRILQIGAGAADGTLALARGAPAAALVVVEPDAAAAGPAAELLARGLVAERIDWRAVEPATELATLAGPFELVVLDARRRDARRCLDLVLPLLAVRGLLLALGGLAGGRLADPGADDLGDPALRALELFNPYLAIHPQLRSVLLPLGDGVALASKSRPLVRELGGPY